MEKIVRQVKEKLELTQPPAPRQEKENATGTETRQLIDFLKSNYHFRYNLIMGYAQYQQPDSETWMPIDERVINTLTMKARLTGINIWNSDTKRFVESQLVDDYHPVNDYLQSVRGTWDGQDHIARLTDTVKTNCKHWHSWFRRWLLAMVAQWLHLDQQYGNAVAPLLISAQGYHKSTFCKSLLPPELSWGYIDNLQIAEKRQVLQAMSQMLLVNLDEFNQISPTLQAGFLKNIIQLSTVKMKRPYGKHVEEFPRLASCIATTNMTDVLSDPTGNRRFIGIELTAPIDVATPPCHPQLYAQLLHLLDQGERYWFDTSETQSIIEHNRRYQLKSPTEMLFDDLFEVTADEQKGRYLSTTAIYDYMRRRGGSQLSSRSIVNLGRTLSGIEGIVKRRNKNGSEYLLSFRQQ